jgi:hypothetical protein
VELLVWPGRCGRTRPAVSVPGDVSPEEKESLRAKRDELISMGVSVFSASTGNFADEAKNIRGRLWSHQKTTLAERCCSSVENPEIKA